MNRLAKNYGRCGLAIVFLVLFLVPFIPAHFKSAPASPPFTIHPENPKYFLFRGKPVVLITATEHYGSVINSRFNFERYLEEAADKRMTLTRLFLLFRELQSARNPNSPLKPESPDFVSPYLRSGPGKALDGEPKFDLDQWNPVYFERLHRFLSRASELGILVEVTLFSNTYSDRIWALNPLRSENNVNGLPAIEWQEYTTSKSAELFQRQVAFVRKVVRETNRYDNIYYEICNEPGGGVEGHSPVQAVDEWQAALAEVIQEEMAKLQNHHLIFGTQAFSYTPQFHQMTEDSFVMEFFNGVNVHPLPDTFYQRSYQMGNFMSKELRLRDLRDYCLATYPRNKPVVMDEDNAASLYRDNEGWIIHRKRAWTVLFSAAHYDYIDFSITAGQESGTEDSQQKIRTWMKHLSTFFESVDFIHSKPLRNGLEVESKDLVESVLELPNDEKLIYLADGRELAEDQAGQPVVTSLRLPLPAGLYSIRLYSPVSGLYSPVQRMESQGRIQISLPAFEQDLVVRIQKEKEVEPKNR